MNPSATPTYKVVSITPELAAEWLKRNTRNRHLNERNVAVLAGAMKRGEWRENGDSFRFSVSDVILDGQHRLAAVVASGVAIRSLVVDGLDDEVQATVDTGRKRSFADVLQIAHVGDSTGLAAVICWVYRWETGQVRSINRPPTHAQLGFIHEKHPELIDSVRAAHAVRRQVPVTVSVVGLSHWLLMGINPEDAAFFFDRFRDGQGLVEGDPIFALRKSIFADLTSSKRRSRMDPTLVLALIIKAWNAYRKGEKVVLLAWRSGGARPEQFPEPS